MTLREFLDAAYVLLVREVKAQLNTKTHQPEGLLVALERLAPFAAQTFRSDEDAAEAAERSRLRQEERDMRRLQAQLQRAGMGAIS